MNDRFEEIDLTSIGSIRILKTVAVLALNLTAASEYLNAFTYLPVIIRIQYDIAEQAPDRERCLARIPLSG
jgi:hypothetical protein